MHWTHENKLDMKQGTGYKDQCEVPFQNLKLIKDVEI